MGGTQTEVAAITINGKVVAMTATAASPRFEQGQTDAANIVKCWNNHDALVESLREMYAEMEKLMVGMRTLDPAFVPEQHSAWQAAMNAHQVITEAQQ